MCDYSLFGLKTRLATDGEQLCVHRFYTGSKGLAAAPKVSSIAAATASGRNWWGRLKGFFSESQARLIPGIAEEVCAVCIPPGAQLELQGLPSKLQRELNVGPCECVTFVQLNSQAYHYRDGVRFANGREVLLQQLNEGLKVIVKQVALATTPDLESALLQAVPEPEGAFSARLLRVG